MTGAQSPADNGLQIVHSTLAGDAVARLVEEHYPLGPIAGCYLLRRGFNDVYRFEAADGSAYVARLCDVRVRGPSNIAFETALLAFLKAKGLAVSAAVADKDGRLWRDVAMPEGPRDFAVFDFLPGDPPLRSMVVARKITEQTVVDLTLLGATHAKIHEAGQSYAGPPSVYRLEADHLLRKQIARVIAAPHLDDRLRGGYRKLGGEFDARLAAVAPALSSVICHGDNHGGNTFMSDDPSGARVAAWFDFDEAGPGYLAYDLAIFLWSILKYLDSAEMNDTGQAMWTAFIEGYRSVREIPPADFDAIALFVSIRHAWFLGEFTGRIPEWGTENVSRDWLGGQYKLMRSWGELETPPA